MYKSQYTHFANPAFISLIFLLLYKACLPYKKSDTHSPTCSRRPF